MPAVKDISPHLDLYRYWDAIRGGRPAPTRRDVDPSKIGPVLRYVALVEPSPDGYRWRLMGTAIAADIGRDLTGRPFGELGGPPSFIQHLIASLDRVLAGRQPIFQTIQYRTACGNDQSVSRLMLPLGPDARTGRMVLLTRIVRTFHPPVPDGDCLEGARGAIDGLFDVHSLGELEVRTRAWALQGPPGSLPRPAATMRIANLWGRGAVPYTIQG